jgi:hypothetical protein
LRRGQAHLFELLLAEKICFSSALKNRNVLRPETVKRNDKRPISQKWIVPNQVS